MNSISTRKRWAAVGLCLAFASIGAAGCTHVVEQNVDNRINHLLPRYLGPADSYQTHIDAASSGAVLRGRVRSVQVVGENVHLRPELTIDRLEIDVQAVEVDPHKGTLEGIGSAQFVGTISSDNLSHYLDSRKLGIRDLKVSISGDRMNVRARPEVEGILPVPVTARGVITPTATGDHLNFEPDRASVTILPIPGPVLSYLSRKLNPVIDLTGLPIPIHITAVSIHDGTITMTGNVDTDAILKAAH